MNILARNDAVGRLDEICLSEDSLIKYISKSNAVNIQQVEFSPNGLLVALALKSGHVLLVDFLTMGIIRVFCL
jgi:hypothetical protein